MAFGIPDAQEFENAFMPAVTRLVDHAIDRLNTEVIPALEARLEARGKAQLATMLEAMAAALRKEP